MIVSLITPQNIEIYNRRRVVLTTRTSIPDPESITIPTMFPNFLSSYLNPNNSNSQESLTTRALHLKDPLTQDSLLSYLKSDPIQTHKLRQFAILSKEGFLNAEWRRRVWPKLLAVSKKRRRASHKNIRNSSIDAAAAGDERQQFLESSPIPKNKIHSPSASDASTLHHRNQNTKTKDNHTQNNNQVPDSSSAASSSRTSKQKEFIAQQLIQIDKDVERSLWKYTTHDTDAERNFKRRQLKRVIVYCLHDTRETPLHYFQGMHDICAVFLLVCGEEVAKVIMEKMVDSYMYDSTHNDSLESVLAVLRLMHTLVAFREPEMAEKMEECFVHTGHYALSWVLTWFSHVIEDLEMISRLFDVFLCQHPLFVIYVSAAYVTRMRKEAILEAEPEFSALYLQLNRFVIPSMDELEKIIQDALELFDELPPNALIERHAAEQKEDTPEADQLSLHYHEAYPFDFVNAKLHPDVKEIHDLTRHSRLKMEEGQEEAKNRRRHLNNQSTSMGSLFVKKNLYPTVAGIISLSVLVLAVYLFPGRGGGGS